MCSSDLDFNKLTKEEHQILNYYCYDDYLYNTNYDKWEYFTKNKSFNSIDINYLTYDRYDADWDEFTKLFHFLRNNEQLFSLYTYIFSVYSYPPEIFNEVMLPDLLKESTVDN